MKYCPHCGTNLAGHVDRCHQCGTGSLMADDGLPGSSSCDSIICDQGHVLLSGDSDLAMSAA